MIHGNKSVFSLSAIDRVIFLPGTFQNVNVSQNETVQVVVSRISSDVAFVTLQFHTQHRNATLSYTTVRKVCKRQCVGHYVGGLWILHLHFSVFCSVL